VEKVLKHSTQEVANFLGVILCPVLVSIGATIPVLSVIVNYILKNKTPMKENILHILNTGLAKLPESTFNITVNYDPIVERYSRKPITAQNIKIVEDKLDKIKQIDNFNVTFEVKRGTDIDYEYDMRYDDNWKTVQYGFYSGDDEEEYDDDEIIITTPKRDYSKIGSFGYERLGDESLNTHEKHWFSEVDYEEETRTTFNFFEYAKVGDLFDTLIELDNLLDKQFEEKKVIADKLISVAKLLK